MASCAEDAASPFNAALPRVRRRGYVEGRLVPQLWLLSPTVLQGADWGLQRWLPPPAELWARLSAVPCITVDLDADPSVRKAQRQRQVSVAHWRAHRRTQPRLYLTELYMRSVQQVVGSPRPYPGVFGDNWYHTHVPGRCESFFAGDCNTGGPIHNDVPLGFGWLAVLSGRKRVLLWPPDAKAAIMQHVSPDFKSHVVPLYPSSSEWHALGASGAVVADVGPQDLLVIPRGWWHQVVNVEDNTVSCVDMVLLHDNLYEFTSTQAHEAHQVIACLVEMVPYRLKRAQEMVDKLLSTTDGVDYGDDVESRITVQESKLMETTSTSESWNLQVEELRTPTSPLQLYRGQQELIRGMRVLLHRLRRVESSDMDHVSQLLSRVRQSAIALRQALGLE